MPISFRPPHFRPAVVFFCVEAGRRPRFPTPWLHVTLQRGFHTHCTTFFFSLLFFVSFLSFFLSSSIIIASRRTHLIRLAPACLFVWSPSQTPIGEPAATGQEVPLRGLVYRARHPLVLVARARERHRPPVSETYVPVPRTGLGKVVDLDECARRKIYTPLKNCQMNSEKC